MTSLEDLMKIEFDKVPRNGGRATSSGILNVYKFRNPAYKQGYGWRYMTKKNKKLVSFSRTSLIGLIEKCASNGISLVILDEDKARVTVESEGIDYDELLKNKLVVL